MRNIFVLGFLMMAVALCNGDSDAGSGDVVVITPTNKSAPPTDATNDSGSGVDDEDDDDDGSTTDVPTKVATTVNIVTTTSTKATTTIPATTPGGDDDDEAEGSGGSGSGTGFPSTVATKDKLEPATDSTDIYISEGTTKMVTNPPKKSRFESTVKTTTDSQSFSTDSKTVVYDTTTETPVAKVRSTTASVKTTGSQDVSTRRPTTKSTTRASTTINLDVVVPPTQRKNKITKPEDKTKEPATEMPKTKQRSPSTPLVKESTTAKEVNALASNQKKSGEGFTLTTEVIAGVVGCALLALLFIAFLMYRLKKRDEGSYLLDDSCGHADAYKKVDNSDKEAFV